MNVRRRLAPIALLAALVTVTTGCFPFALPRPNPSGTSVLEHQGEQQTADSVTVTWLAYSSAGGVTGKTKITRGPAETPGDFRVEFSQNEVGGIGDSSQSGAWNAAIVATLLLGEPPEGVYSFETDGRVDGPSAGALTAAGVIALMRGDDFDPKVTMTGTINTTGTIGPVGGIPEKLKGAADAGFTTVLIPLGQRNSENRDGDPVDVVRLGKQLGIQVVEVGDIYEAYSKLTGKTLDAPRLTGEPRLDDKGYDKVQPQVNAMLARYADGGKRIVRLPTVVQDSLGAYSGFAGRLAKRAQDLQQQGAQAGAYMMAAQAASLVEAIAALGEMFTPLATQGADGLNTILAQAQDTSTAGTEFMAFLDQLNEYTPKTAADVEGLVTAYAGAFDAYSLLGWANGQIKAVQDQFANGEVTDIQVVLNNLMMPLMYAQLSRSMVQTAKVDFEIGRDNPGAKISKDVDVQVIGDFFRRGAEANFEAFRATVLHDLATRYGVSDDVMLGKFASIDMNVALAADQKNSVHGIAAYIGEKNPNQAYAVLGYGLTNYSRNQGLMDVYYNNAITDENLNVVGVRSEAVLGRALDLGRDQLGSQIADLRDNGTEPVLSVGRYEYAGLSKQGGLTEQFDAINAYSSGYLTTRMLAYITGLVG